MQINKGNENNIFIYLLCYNNVLSLLSFYSQFILIDKLLALMQINILTNIIIKSYNSIIEIEKNVDQIVYAFMPIIMILC
jgi:hypothetical protein